MVETKRRCGTASVRRKRLRAAAGCAVVLMLAGVVWYWSLPAARYRVTFLTTPSGEMIAPYGINEVGQVIGSVEVGGGERRIFLWDPAHGAQDLGSFDSPKHVAPLSLNDVGQIAGVVWDANAVCQAFLRDRDGAEHLLGTLGGLKSQVYAMNNRGHVVGHSETPVGNRHAVRWSVGGGVTDLGTLGGDQSMAYSINDRDQVAGFAQIADGAWHACLWDPNGRVTDLGPTSFLFPEAGCIHVNSEGQVVGRFGSATDDALISSWHLETGVQPLPALDVTDVFPRGFNDAGQCVVDTRTARFEVGGHYLVARRDLYLWDPNAGYRSLKKSWGRRGFLSPCGVNNRGQIVGLLIMKRMEDLQGVLLEPIEEEAAASDR